MAKSRRAKPTSERAGPPADAGAPAWTAEAAEAAAVIDLVPVSAVSVPSRQVSGLERGVDFLSRPFGLAITLGVAVWSVFRRRRTALVPLFVLGLLASSSCNRYDEIWAGVEFQEDGRMRLAAEDPLCGCLHVINTAGQDLALRSRFHGTTIGNTILKADQSVVFRFDWAGPENDDVYILEATDAQGNLVNLKTALRIHEQSNWMACSTADCPLGELLLNVGQVGQ